MTKSRLLRTPVPAAIIAIALLTLSACSRVQGDWKTAQAADTIDAYSDFVHKHPDAAEVTEARARIEQLGEDRDWQRASTADTRETYAQFIALHPNSKWTQEARIRIENFALGPTPIVAPNMAPPSAPAAPAAMPAAPARAAAARTAAAASKPTPARPPPAPERATHAVATHATHAAVAAAPVSTTSAAAGGQLVQLGAFNSEAIAQEQWQKLAKRHAELAGLKPRTETVVRDGRTLYRLRTAVADPPAALKLCSAMQHSGDACIVVTGSR